MTDTEESKEKANLRKHRKHYTYNEVFSLL